MAMLDFCMMIISSCTFCVRPEAKSSMAVFLAASSSLTLFSEFLMVPEKLFCGVTGVWAWVGYLIKSACAPNPSPRSTLSRSRL